MTIRQNLRILKAQCNFAIKNRDVLLHNMKDGICASPARFCSLEHRQKMFLGIFVVVILISQLAFILM